MFKVPSLDGTPIAFDRNGEGPPLILVGPALADRSALSALAALLSSSFTVYNYDRRGRGDSCDREQSGVEREIEDIQVIISEVAISPALTSNIHIPTLVMDGGNSPHWLRNSSQAVAAALPAAHHRTLEDQDHGVPAEVLAPILKEFFTDRLRT